MPSHSAWTIVHEPYEVPIAASHCATIPLQALLNVPPPAFRNEQLLHMYTRLIKHEAPFAESALDAKAYVYKRVGREDQALQQTIKDIVNCSYNFHYLHDQLTYEDIASESDKRTEVFMVYQQIGDVMLPLVSVRVLMDQELDCFELFTRQHADVRAVEFSRFSYHPLLDVPVALLDKEIRLLLDLHKRHLFRVLLRGAFRFLKSRKYRTSYVIMPPHVKRYMVGCGFVMHDMPESQLIASEAHDKMRRSFSKYWKPDRPVREQPAVYKLDFRIKPLFKEVKGQKVVL